MLLLWQSEKVKSDQVTVLVVAMKKLILRFQDIYVNFFKKSCLVVRVRFHNNACLKTLPVTRKDVI